MALESTTYIDGLVATNPAGTDARSQGDDHIRMVKSAVKATFPNITGAVTATHTELNKIDGVTSTTAELNILDGVTSTAAELNILDGVIATAAELNILDGVTATATELNKLDGVTATTAELNLIDGVTATTAELNYVDGVTSNVQTQLNTKAPLASPTFTGNPIVPTQASGNNTTRAASTAFVEDAVNGLGTSSSLTTHAALRSSSSVYGHAKIYTSGGDLYIVTT